MDCFIVWMDLFDGFIWMDLFGWIYLDGLFHCLDALKYIPTEISSLRDCEFGYGFLFSLFDYAYWEGLVIGVIGFYFKICICVNGLLCVGFKFYQGPFLFIFIKELFSKR